MAVLPGIVVLRMHMLIPPLRSYKDWWWKAMLGKCYLHLGLYRDAEKQLKSAIMTQDMVTTDLDLAKVYVQLDQPKSALDFCSKGAQVHSADTHLVVGMARVYDQLNDLEKSTQLYQRVRQGIHCPLALTLPHHGLTEGLATTQVLEIDSGNVEAIACLAANYFYEDQPEISLRLFRRLFLVRSLRWPIVFGVAVSHHCQQMGVNSTELWNNLGLACFYAAQYDISLSCFEKALGMGEDEALADVWYNLGHVAVGLGELGLAFECFRIAISFNASHAESFCNLGVLELRKGNTEEAKVNFATATRLAPHLYEPLFNCGMCCTAFFGLRSVSLSEDR